MRKSTYVNVNGYNWIYNWIIVLYTFCSSIKKNVNGMK